MGDSTVKVPQSDANADADAAVIANDSVIRASTTVHRQEVVLGTATDVTKFDYGNRTDGNPRYVGKHTQGSTDADTDWIIQRFTYDSSDRVTEIQTLQGAWDNRTNLSWS